MSLIQELNKPVAVPSYSKILKQFSRTSVAYKLGISSPYLSNILNGHMQPSKELDSKLLNLAAAIQAELDDKEN